MTTPSPPLVEVLTIAGCPNAAAAIAIARRSLSDAGITAPVVVLEIATREEAVAQRFLGSPTVRVNGVDVEPGADTRTDFVLSCRSFRTSSGYSGVPAGDWVASALATSARR